MRWCTLAWFLITANEQWWPPTSWTPDPLNSTCHIWLSRDECQYTSCMGLSLATGLVKELGNNCILCLRSHSCLAPWKGRLQTLRDRSSGQMTSARGARRKTQAPSKEKDIVPEPKEPGHVHPELGGQIDAQGKGAVHGVVEEGPAIAGESSVCCYWAEDVLRNQKTERSRGRRPWHTGKAAGLWSTRLYTSRSWWAR